VLERSVGQSPCHQGRGDDRNIIWKNYEDLMRNNTLHVFTMSGMPQYLISIGVVSVYRDLDSSPVAAGTIDIRDAPLLSSRGHRCVGALFATPRAS